MSYLFFLTNGPWDAQVELQSAMSELYLQKAHFDEKFYSAIKVTFE
ncbi:hypothetical protein [Streptococcus suis]|nr:hypothetical protein [Streptococcus suis]